MEKLLMTDKIPYLFIYAAVRAVGKKKKRVCTTYVKLDKGAFLYAGN
jgi:hypothetical protein